MLHVRIGSITISRYRMSMHKNSTWAEEKLVHFQTNRNKTIPVIGSCTQLMWKAGTWKSPINIKVSQTWLFMKYDALYSLSFLFPVGFTVTSFYWAPMIRYSTQTHTPNPSHHFRTRWDTRIVWEAGGGKAAFLTTAEEFSHRWIRVWLRALNPARDRCLTEAWNLESEESEGNMFWNLFCFLKEVSNDLMGLLSV